MSQFEVPSVVIDPALMQECNESTSFLLKVPERAAGTSKAKFWSEQFDVIEASMGGVEDNPERLEIIVRFKVAAESEYDDNIGRVFRARYLINPSKIGVKESKERTMTLMSIGRLNALLRACGFDTQGQSTDLKDYFYGESPCVVGCKVYAMLKSYTDREGTPRQDITQFTSLDAGDPAVKK